MPKTDQSKQTKKCGVSTIITDDKKMNTTKVTEEISIHERVNRINQLNLEPIIVKSMDKDEGEGWTLEQAIAAEKLYKRFLILTAKFPNESIVPNKIIDAFWHYHILDTKKYAVDCEETFGYFIHHFPYFGMRGVEDAKNLQEAFDETQNLFASEFGESLSEASILFTNAENSSKCDGSGGGTNDCGSCKSGGTCTSGKCAPGSKPSSKVDFEIRPSLSKEQRELVAEMA